MLSERCSCALTYFHFICLHEKHVYRLTNIGHKMLKCQDDCHANENFATETWLNALIRMQLRSEPEKTTFKKRMFRNKTYSH